MLEAWRADVAELVDASDLKSVGAKAPSRFESGRRHHCDDSMMTSDGVRRGLRRFGSMPELAVMAVPINVLVAEHLSEVRDVDFQARPIDAGEARHEHTVHRCRGIGSVAGIGAQQ